MITPAILAQRSHANFGRIVAQPRIGKTFRAEEEPEFAAPDLRGATIFVRQRPTVPQVEPGQDRRGLLLANQSDLEAVDRTRLPMGHALWLDG